MTLQEREDVTASAQVGQPAPAAPTRGPLSPAMGTSLALACLQLCSVSGNGLGFPFPPLQRWVAQGRRDCFWEKASLAQSQTPHRDEAQTSGLPGWDCPQSPLLPLPHALWHPA